MKVIDLLNKIANGEEVPKKIRISFYDEGTPEIYNFTYNKNIRQYEDDDGFTLSSALNITLILNDKVEIMEDKKIEKIEKLYKYIDKEIDEKEKDMYYENILKVYDGSEYEIDESMSFVIDKINEIIDKLNSMEE